MGSLFQNNFLLLHKPNISLWRCKFLADIILGQNVIWVFGICSCKDLCVFLSFILHFINLITVISEKVNKREVPELKLSTTKLAVKGALPLKLRLESKDLCQCSAFELSSMIRTNHDLERFNPNPSLTSVFLVREQLLFQTEIEIV